MSQVYTAGQTNPIPLEYRSVQVMEPGRTRMGASVRKRRPTAARSSLRPFSDRLSRKSRHVGLQIEYSSDSSSSSLDTMSSAAPPRMVTDASETSTIGNAGRTGASAVSAESQTGPSAVLGAIAQLDQSELEEKEDQSSSIGSTGRQISAPQHELLFDPIPVDPLDISYQFTPGSVRIKTLLMSRLAQSSPLGRLQVADLSRRGIGVEDARLIAQVIRENQSLAILKLGYNNLEDEGASIVAAACVQDGVHHQGLTILDFGFNDIGNAGCAAISLHAVASNQTLRTLFLSGNRIREKGVMALAGAILRGCGLSNIHLSTNPIGSLGIKFLSSAIAEADSRRLRAIQQNGGVVAAGGPVALDELRIQDISMKPKGFSVIPSMLLTNAGLRVLSLSHNKLDDKDIGLLSQALSQNKNVPLATIQLSFNSITDVGVEALMNAIWGSKTLRELRLDNNRIKDRGAQLCSVVLGSVALETLDIGFNRVTTVGIKAIMKSLSENSSLTYLSMAGIPVDQNASKALSYALAYNSSLQVLKIDSCCIGYSGQRHIVAGVVSNRTVKLRMFTGFPLGPITKTLGVPQLPEAWGNDRVLSFIRFMWEHFTALAQNAGQNVMRNTKRGPAPPSMVATAAKRAFASLSEIESSRLHFEQVHGQPEGSPVPPVDAAILEQSETGVLQIPAWDDGGEAAALDDINSDLDSFSDSSTTFSVASLPAERRSKNLQWLQAHSQALYDVGNIVFNNADLWQLHQYFFSPVYSTTDDVVEESIGDTEAQTSRLDESKPPAEGVASISGSDPDAMHANKRRALNQKADECIQHSSKRTKNLKPRIAYFPRIRSKLESLGTKPSAQTLSLLRQLKYVENTLLNDKNVYVDDDGIDDFDAEYPGTVDVENILLDLL